MTATNKALSGISVLIRRCVYLTLAFADSKFKNPPNPITIFSYHSIANDNWRYSIDEDEVKKQLLYLKKNYNIISLKRLSEFLSGIVDIKTPSVIITFDDGYKDVLLLKEFLKENAIKPAIFLLATPTVPNIKELGIKKQFLSNKDVSALIMDGWEVGSHSNTHSNLITLSDVELKREIIGSKTNLEKQLNTKIRYFAYPRGKYNENVLKYINTAGYELALTMDDGVITRSTNQFRIPRVGVDRTHSFSEFKSLSSLSNIRARRLIKNSFLGRYI